MNWNDSSKFLSMTSSTRSSSGPKVSTVGIALDGESRDLIQRLAVTEGRSRSSVVRQAIKRYAESKGTD